LTQAKRTYRSFMGPTTLPTTLAVMLICTELKTNNIFPSLKWPGVFSVA